MFAFSRRRLVIAVMYVLFMALLGFVILPQLDQFSTSLPLLLQADAVYLGVALAFVAMTYICAAMVYQRIAIQSVRFKHTLAVQLAGLLVNRVLPAGIGGIGLNYLYLKAHKHSTVQAVTVVSTNTAIGGIGHGLVLLGMFVMVSLFGLALPNVSLPLPVIITTIGVSVVLIVGLVITSASKFGRQLKQIRKHYSWSRITTAILLSSAMTLATAASLWLCLQAVGISITLPTTFFIMTAAIAAGTAIPTPGGLGGYEAALVSGLIALGSTPSLALAGTLLFRIVTYWLGLVIGAIALLTTLRLQLLTSLRTRN